MKSLCGFCVHSSASAAGSSAVKFSSDARSLFIIHQRSVQNFDKLKANIRGGRGESIAEHAESLDKISAVLSTNTAQILASSNTITTFLREASKRHVDFK